DQLRGLAIRDRHRLVAGLHLDAERAAVANVHRQLARGAREVERDAQLVGELAQLLPPFGHKILRASSTLATVRPASATSSIAAATRSPWDSPPSPSGK